MSFNFNAFATAHGIMTSLPVIVIFPLGGILLRRIPWTSQFPKPVIVHRRLQWVGWSLFIIGVIIGAVATSVIAANNRLFLRNAHIVLGILLAIMVLQQPLSGKIHHRLFKARTAAWNARDGGSRTAGAMTAAAAADGNGRMKKPGRTWISRVHMNTGRIVIVAGMINGGLGLVITNRASFRDKTHQVVGVFCYSLVAGIMGLAYLVVSVKFAFEERRWEREKSGADIELNEARRDGDGFFSEDPDRDMQIREAQRPKSSAPPAARITG